MQANRGVHVLEIDQLVAFCLRFRKLGWPFCERKARTIAVQARWLTDHVASLWKSEPAAFLLAILRNPLTPTPIADEGDSGHGG